MPAPADAAVVSAAQTVEACAVTYIDLYCERVGPGLLAEPLNALTNVGFFLAAWFALRVARTHGTDSLQLRILLALAVAIGIGSMLFHTFATLWARVLDEVPILIFQLLFTWTYLLQVIGTRRRVASGCLIGYLGAAIVCRQFPQVLNGSLVYLPALLLTTGLGCYHRRQRKPEPGLLLAAAGTLGLAVFLRTLDAAVCDRFALGTHFLWHVCVAVVVYLCLRALIAGWHSFRDFA